ncbi:MAG: metallophosphoesterase [Phycisphaerales bacterium]|nr:metallophosphoesterase [Phycisphaerales bacterium]
MASQVWVTADTHFGHEEAIRLFARPARDVREMDDMLLDRINAHVGKRDTLLHLGDFTGPMSWSGDEGDASLARARDLRERIRCRRVELVRGNHDPRKRRFRRIFDAVHDILSFRGWTGGDERIVCCHYPMRSWQGMWNGALHLYGHAHGAAPEEGRSCDVGVDCWELGPVTLDRACAMLVARPLPARESHHAARQPSRTALP